jgi:hypothetical protein
MWQSEELQSSCRPIAAIPGALNPADGWSSINIERVAEKKIFFLGLSLQ